MSRNAKHNSIIQRGAFSSALIVLCVSFVFKHYIEDVYSRFVVLLVVGIVLLIATIIGWTRSFGNKGKFFDLICNYSTILFEDKLKIASYWIVFLLSLSMITGAKLSNRSVNEKRDLENQLLAFYSSGLNAVDKHNYEKAIEMFQKLDPNYKDAQEKLDKSKKAYAKELVRQLVDLHKSGDFEKAMNKYVLAKKYDNEPPIDGEILDDLLKKMNSINYDKGMHAYESGKIDSAFEYFSKVYANDRGYIETPYYLALTYAKKNNFIKAVELLSEIQPEHITFKRAKQKIRNYNKIIRKRNTQEQYMAAQTYKANSQARNRSNSSFKGTTSNQTSADGQTPTKLECAISDELLHQITIIDMNSGVDILTDEIIEAQDRAGLERTAQLFGVSVADVERIHNKVTINEGHSGFKCPPSEYAY